ncbi:hypothetical protein POM88_032011 [Heracleum sosnowskyi]|uniref:Uncharacterized protein n=1 Tax=Heracleum sosnowskyi TaxID=360622 RepID=A0AAD8HZB2_9APIA|nr:hypothetical protein POM88_032011 [Heracleum sosnowskyi]
MRTWAASVSMCDLVVSWKNVDVKTKQKGAFLAWCIWAEWNSQVFDNKTTPNAVLVDRVCRLADEYGNYTLRIYKSVQSRTQPSSRVWRALPCGRVFFAATRRIRAFWSPEIAEAKAIVLAAKLGRRSPPCKISTFRNREVRENHCPREISSYVLMNVLSLNL